jgi:hypothetical protein
VYTLIFKFFDSRREDEKKTSVYIYIYIYIYLAISLTIADFLLWGALSDMRIGL